MGVFDPHRVLEHVHGHIGWLAALAATHPAILLRRRRTAHLAVGLATALVTVAAALGSSIYPAYRREVKADLFTDAPSLGWMFERKEHMAVGAVFLAWAGALAYIAAASSNDPSRDVLRDTAHWAFVGSALFAVSTAVLGTIVASYRSF